MLVYHGSTCRVDMPLADVCRNNLDFGRGFYVTGLRTQASCQYGQTSLAEYV